jgi:predicted amidophosphoribosyltransferase
VLILDDTIGSGGTIKEIARALKTAAAVEVYGLSVAKDAKFTKGGIDLAKERWE